MDKIYDSDGREYTPSTPAVAPPALNEPAQPESAVTASEGAQDKEQSHA